MLEADLPEARGVRLEGLRRGQPRQPEGRGCGAVLHEDTTLQVVPNEKVAAAWERSRFPRHEEAAVVEREVEVREDPLLQLGAEVHERVARDEQVDARDRRVPVKVVAAEDDRAAQVVA